jgi:hypothetical protein
MKTNMKYALMLLIAASAITGCKKDDDEETTPPPVQENEVLTTLRVTFDDQGPGSDKVWEYRDVDGDGGNPAVITADTLLANANYTGTLLLLNESVSPVDTSINEVIDEATIHQFFYQVFGANITFHYADMDSNGKPIGIQTTVNTGTASSGTTKVTLIHECVKTAPGVSDGDITNAGGSTDIEVTFPAVVN